MAGYILAFDYGLKRIGVAIGNSLTTTATPLTTLIQSSAGPDWREVDHLISEWQPQQLLLGMPDTQTTSGVQLCKAIKKFGQELQTRYDLPLDYIDDELTSAVASATLKKARQSGLRKRIKKPEIDRQAAALILTQWFNDSQS